MNILIFGKDGQLGKAFKEVLGSKNLEDLYWSGYSDAHANSSQFVNLKNKK
jgi:dTDP-4-dehydrorhamnose reductase